MRIPAIALGVVAVFFVLGCDSTPTRYQKLGTTGDGGYSDEKISDDTFSIKFTANSDTSLSAVCRYLYRRAAEVTLKNGYTYFAVIRDPCALDSSVPVYRNDDEYRDTGRPALMLPMDMGTWFMTIQCFNAAQEASKVQLLDAKAYLSQN
jgi:hypothetical protein